MSTGKSVGIALAIIGAVLTGGCTASNGVSLTHDRASYQLGYDDGDFAAVQPPPWNTPRKECQAMLAAGGGQSGNHIASPNDYMAGCRAGFEKHGWRWS
jgi:hypothetical protein